MSASSGLPSIMGVLNVTPDSFSDGGDYLDPELAIARARQIMAQGAHMIDVGGESTRPGAARVAPAEEQRRVLPVIEALASEGIPVSIDTVHASTARLAVQAGAIMINDVSGGTADPEMLQVVAETGVRFVIMHWRGIPDPEHARSTYADVVEEVREALAGLVDRALAAGVAADRLILDPGFGFDKTTAQGWQLLAGLDRLAALGYPLLLGVSRKRMLGETLGDGATTADRDLATAVVSALAAGGQAWGVRVHNVAATATALKVVQAWQQASGLQAAEAAAREAHALEAHTLDANGAVPAGTHATGVSDSAAPCASSALQQPAGDRITLTGLEVFAHHGVFDFEREQGQRFVIDAEVVTDFKAAAAGDELARTVNYAELAGAILEAVANDPVDLIETLVERVAQVVLGFAGVQQARVTVHKPDAPIDAKFGDVSVTVVRDRGQS